MAGSSQLDVRILMTGQFEEGWLEAWEKSVEKSFERFGWKIVPVVPENVADAIGRLERCESFDFVYLGPGIGSAAAERIAKACFSHGERPDIFLYYHHVHLVSLIAEQHVPVYISTAPIIEAVHRRLHDRAIGKWFQ